MLLTSRFSVLALVLVLSASGLAQTVVFDSDPNLPNGHPDQISWTVSGVQQWGRYLTGDIWFVPAGAQATVTAIAPAPQQLGADYIHGSMKNPQGGHVLFGNLRYPRRLSYDSRVAADGLGSSFSITEWQLTQPQTQAPFLTLLPGDVIVSTISSLTPATPCETGRPYQVVIPGGGVLGCAGTPTRFAAVLSCVGAYPGTDAFRRPYGMDPTKRAGLRHLTASQLQLNLLPRLGRITGPSGLSPAQMVPFFARVWLDQWPGEWGEDRTHPNGHLPGYGQATMDLVSQAAGVLLTDYYHPNPVTQTEIQETADFKTLLYGVLQFGIDSWGLLQNGSVYDVVTGLAVTDGDSHRFDGAGGKGGGQKFPMLLCKRLFGTNAWDPAQDAPHATTGMSPPQHVVFEDFGAQSGPVSDWLRWVFKEDEQVFRAASLTDPPGQGNRLDWAWQGSPWKWRKHDDDPLNTPVGASTYQHVVPGGNGTYDPVTTQYQWTLGQAHHETYRFQISKNYVGIALAARVLDMMDDWNNDAFFGYVDRWMIPQNDACDGRYNTLQQSDGSSAPAAFRGHLDAPHRHGQGAFPATDFCRALWDLYRWQTPARGVTTLPVPSTASLPLAFNAVLPASSMLVASSQCGIVGDRIPTLVTQHRAVAGTPMLFELYSLDPDGEDWIEWMFSGWPTPGIRLTLFPTQPMIFVDPTGFAAPALQFFNAYGYAASAWQLPTALQGLTVAVQALVLPVDPGTCPVVSNALTFQVQ